MVVNTRTTIDGQIFARASLPTRSRTSRLCGWARVDFTQRLHRVAVEVAPCGCVTGDAGGDGGAHKYGCMVEPGSPPCTVQCRCYADAMRARRERGACRTRLRTRGRRRRSSSSEQGVPRRSLQRRAETRVCASCRHGCDTPPRARYGSDRGACAMTHHTRALTQRQTGRFRRFRAQPAKPHALVAHLLSGPTLCSLSTPPSSPRLAECRLRCRLGAVRRKLLREGIRGMYVPFVQHDAVRARPPACTGPASHLRRARRQSAPAAERVRDNPRAGSVSCCAKPPWRVACWPAVF